MPSRIAGNMAYIASFGLVATSLSFDAHSLVPGDRPVISLVRTAWTMPHAAVNAKQPFSCDIINNGPRGIKVLGVPGACGKGGCILPLDPPTLIPAHESRTFHFEYVTHQVGPFEATAKIFLGSADNDGIVVPINVKGNAHNEVGG